MCGRRTRVRSKKLGRPRKVKKLGRPVSCSLCGSCVYNPALISADRGVEKAWKWDTNDGEQSLDAVRRGYTHFDERVFRLLGDSSSGGTYARPHLDDREIYGGQHFPMRFEKRLPATGRNPSWFSLYVFLVFFFLLHGLLYADGAGNGVAVGAVFDAFADVAGAVGEGGGGGFVYGVEHGGLGV